MTTNRLPLCVLVLVFGLSASPAAAADKPANGGQAPQYTLEEISGDVIVIPSGENQWKTAEEGDSVRTGDEVRVGPAGEAVLFLNEDTVIHLSEDTSLKVDRLVSNDSDGFLNRLKLLAGRVISEVKNLSKTRSSFEVESGGVICGVRGTAFEVARYGDQVETATYEGEVEVKTGDTLERVKAGYRLGFRKNRVHLRRKLDRMEKDRFDRWVKHRKNLRDRYIKRLKALKAKRQRAVEKKIQIKKVQKKRQKR
jgi:hypothetical protein